MYHCLTTKIRVRFALFVLIFLLETLQASADVVARCGQGYLELIDGYRVLHLKGNPYEMGFQQGTLLKDECRSLIHELFEVKAKEADIDLFGLKVSPRQAVSTIFRLQRGYIPSRFIEEMEGLAAGVGVPVEDVFTANAIPELFHCSGFALQREIVADNTLLHGRVLDYGTDWKLQEHAVLVVAEPDQGIPFVNVTYAGFIGSVTGMNAKGVSIGEMGGKGLGKWAGTPMSFLVRRVLEEADSLDQAVALMRDSKRTCEYYYVIADGPRNKAVGLEAGADEFSIVKPGEAHPRLPTPIPNSVLLSAGERYSNLCGIVNNVRNQGEKFTIDRAIRLMDAPVAMKSNLHNVLFAPSLGKLWVANASSDRQPAWTQRYYAFDFQQLLHQPRPSTGGKEFPMVKRPNNRQPASVSR